MKIDVLTIFPEFFGQVFDFGIIRRARLASIVDIDLHDIREYATDKHKMVDDRPFGGGDGMVLKAEPIFLAVESIWPDRTAARKALLLSAQGRMFDQAMANRLAGEQELLLICGRY